MAEKSYPVPYYKDLHAPRSAHSPKEERILAEDGWHEDRHAMPRQEYPKILYSKIGSTVTVGRYPDGGGPLDAEACRAEEAAWLDKGYSVTPIPRREVTKLPDELVTSASRTAAAEAANGRMDSMEERIDRIDEGMAQILELLRSQKPKRKMAEPELDESKVI